MEKEELINLVKKYAKEDVPIIDKSEVTWARGGKTQSFIGQGGFGKVYHINYNGQEAVLKTISLLKAEESDIMLIIDEAKSLKKAYCYTHYIPQFHGIYRGRTKIGLIMNFIKGAPFIDIYKTLDDKMKVKILINVCKALKSIHDNKLIHRDLKPDNIICNIDNPSEPEAFIIDFGLCKIAKNTKTRTASAKGTPQYKAPELFDGENELVDSPDEKNIEISYKVDIWAFGAMISEVFSGVIPWSQRTTNWLHIESLLLEKEEFPIPESINEERIREIIKNCTNLDPDKRPSDDEILKHLEDILLSI
jgi:serine/threonine protein kinase